MQEWFNIGGNPLKGINAVLSDIKSRQAIGSEALDRTELVSLTELNDRLREDNARIIKALEDRSWAEKYPFTFALYAAIIGGFFGAIIAQTLQYITR